MLRLPRGRSVEERAVIFLARYCRHCWWWYVSKLLLTGESRSSKGAGANAIAKKFRHCVALNHSRIKSLVVSRFAGSHLSHRNFHVPGFWEDKSPRPPPTLQRLGRAKAKARPREPERRKAKGKPNVSYVPLRLFSLPPTLTRTGDFVSTAAFSTSQPLSLSALSSASLVSRSTTPEPTRWSSGTSFS